MYKEASLVLKLANHLKIIIIASAAIAIYWLIQLIIGHSPPLSSMNTIFIVMIIGMLFHLYREVGEMKIDMKHSFTKIKDDMNLIKKKLKV